MTFFPTINEWSLFGVILVSLLLILGAFDLIRSKFSISVESSRKLVHIIVGLVVSACPLLFSHNRQLVLLSFLFICINWYLLKSKKIESINNTGRISYGTVYFPFSVLILSFSFWDKPISFILAIWVLSLADPIASMIGMKGRITFKPWRDLKSRRGSLAMFGSSFIIIMIGTDILARVYEANFLIPLPILVGISLLTAFSATLAEAVSFRGSDNLSIPLITFLTYEILLINYTHGSLPSLIIWVVLSLAVFCFSWRFNALTSSGAISGYLIGVIIFGVGSWPWIIPLVFFFISSSILSHLHGKNHAKRNILQVLANGGVGTIAAIIYFFWELPPAIVMYLGAIGAATADTWATEIGYYSRAKPRLALSKKVVDRGTSGGITFLGVLGSLCGALTIGIMGEFILELNDLLIPLATAGLIGSFTDSLLGRFIQAQFQCRECGRKTEDRYHCERKTKLIFGSKYVGNDMVNFINTTIGATVAYFFWMNYG